MKTFQIKNEDKVLYFENFERRSGLEELNEVLSVLSESGFSISKKKE